MASITITVSDTIKPIITPTGSDATLEVGVDTYTELGATVTDNDPAYSESVTVGGDTVNTSVPGVYVVEYTAPADASGNTPDMASITITVSDTIAPTGTVSINSGATYATSTAATLTLSCADSGSGCSMMRISTDGTLDTEPYIAFTTSSPVTLPGPDGVNTVKVQYKDASGNVSTGVISDTIILDTVKPYVLSSTIIGPNTIRVIFNEVVSSVPADYVKVTITPPGDDRTILTSTSGSTTIDLTFSGTSAASGATGTLYFASPKDVAGNSVAAGSASIADGQSPNVTLTSASPNPVWTTFSVTATFDEPVSGLLVGEISVTNGVANTLSGGPTVYTFDIVPTAPGPVSVSIPTGVAQDAATNTNTASSPLARTFTPLNLVGFRQPVDMGTILNTVKGGSTVPLKFEIFQGNTEMTDTTLVTSVKPTLPFTCTTGTPEDAVEEIVTTGGTALRYSGSPDGFFIDNWKTPSTSPNKCMDVKVTVVGGATLTGHFKFK